MVTVFVLTDMTLIRRRLPVSSCSGETRGVGAPCLFSDFSFITPYLYLVNFQRVNFWIRILLLMSKGSRSGRNRNTQTKVSHLGPADGGNMADSVPTPLTADKLVSELDKLRKNISSELTALLNSSLESLRSSVASIGSTLSAQATTITDMETSLTDHSDRITHLEQEVSNLHSKLSSATEENIALKANVEDLVSRSKRQNIRVLGLPEDVEGKDPRQFMTDFFAEVLGDILTAPPVLDRAHRSLRPKPRQGQNPRPFIVRFHRYVEKETVLKWAKATKEILYKGHRVKFYKDFCASVAKKRAAFNNVKSLLYKRGVRFGMIYPAKLRVSHNGSDYYFDSPEAAERFYHQNFPA